MLEPLMHTLGYFRKRNPAKQSADHELPLRSELFSSSQMERHGKVLAGHHTVSTGPARNRLLSRLDENEAVLIKSRDLLAETVKANYRITPAGEWLLDNYYLIEEQIRTARRHLPKGYSRELPRLNDGPSAGLPRVYDIALETISHGDGRVDPENLGSFVAAYQTVTELTLGELWAIPIMLRLALIENLRRVAVRISADRNDRNLAGYWADQITAMAESDPNSLILVVADMVRSDPPIANSFVAEFTCRLQGKSPALAMPLAWLEQRLSESGMTIEQSVHAETQQQAADQVSISNSIGSLRFLAAMDWPEFVERMSAVERVLREDPHGIYGRMDFATRDRYRHVVERLAKSSSLSESGVAFEAVGLARAADGHAADRSAGDDRTAHVGFYLIDEGLPQLEQVIRRRISFTEYLRKTGDASPFLFYVGAITLITALFSGGLLAATHAGGLPAWLLAVIGAVLLLGASQLAVELVNWLTTLLVTPRQLPRMDYAKGIPPESRTLVVIPTMLTGAQNIEELIEALEVRFLANRDGHLHFGLLTDFPDAASESMPEDEELVHLVGQRIRALNEKYRTAQSHPFFLFHRPRQWNDREQIWMGYERKRGKLAALNALLRKGAQGIPGNTFSLIIGETAILPDVRYVITLDTDTQLPRDSARQFAAAMAHPLNRACFDEDRRCITAGYGILQPRVAASLPGTNRSWYAHMSGREPGIDPYTRAVSDVYQDLFGEGSFVGKGIYDVDAFERTLNGRFPENRILSHDLIEGCYVRSGLLSDVMLYEEYPPSYRADVSRRHRWIRGDWQLVRWLLPGVPGSDGRRITNPLSLLSRWKLFDNLRRSLVPFALSVLLLLGWTVMSLPWVWTLSVIGVMFAPFLIGSALELVRKPEDVLPGQHISAVGRSMAWRCIQVVFALACLPYEAYYSLDAILRTTWRMLVTRRKLLEWNPSGAPERQSRDGFPDICRTLWIAPLLAAATFGFLLYSRPDALIVAGPILLLWFVSPGITWWISLPLVRRRARLTEEQTVYLRKLSRKTWAFFETFIGPEDHWLPPDNYQEYRVATVSHRTSPTNMGLALLANLSAYDFGYIPAGRLLERTENALRTMESMDRHRGHFYNWYDTQTLKPLLPAYISSVDSGNLAAHLLTLRAGLLALPDEHILGGQIFEGLRDTFGILMDAAHGLSPKENAYRNIRLLGTCIESACSQLPATIADTRRCLEDSAVSVAAVIDRLVVEDAGGEAAWWAGAIAGQCRTALDDLLHLVPENGEQVDAVPTLRKMAEAGNQHAVERIAVAERLALRAGELARMDYDFLFDSTRKLLSIGYSVSDRRRDASYYDLLASEARLACFVAIAQGQLPQESWFALGRLLTSAGGEPILLSWSGSMFEY
ncbi:MAG TPA: glycosyltransferase family 2 protein, partial [Dissulfurispiraceae bacterium]|nr:glycosyltransferase family 2 protein [Dissulfurispiraceae bacterium]